MKKWFVGFALAGFLLNVSAENTGTNWVSQPLTLLQSLNVALQQNAAILKAKNDLQAQYGVVVQTRAVALPQVTASGQYKRTERQAIESFPSGSPPPDQDWNIGVQVVQTVFDGGKTIAALSAAGATKKQALANYQAAVADALLSVRLAYYDILLAAVEI